MEIDTVPHKFLHGIVGGGMGLILRTERPLQGFTAEKAADLGRFTAATTALFLGQNATIAMATAENAVEQNFLRHVLKFGLRAWQQLASKNVKGKGIQNKNNLKPTGHSVERKIERHIRSADEDKIG